jgi:hypothetical protein
MEKGIRKSIFFEDIGATTPNYIFHAASSRSVVLGPCRVVLPFGRPASDTASEAGRREKLVVMRNASISNYSEEIKL